MSTSYTAEFEQALTVGRPPNVRGLFPNSKALLVSGKVIDRAMLAKGGAICLAANARSEFVTRGALRAAQRANAPLILEIAKSEGGPKGYCAVSFWNLARMADALCNELGITVPVAVHADHFALKSIEDLEAAKVEIPTLFEAGITSIALDASHQPEDENLLANLALAPILPRWAGLETEVGEIKGAIGLSTPEEALFLIQGLNAHGVFPDWIALNNGTSHGIEESESGIQVELTAQIHRALEPYGVSGTQHGTSGNSSERLRQIAARTRTTKANVATALQFISWGVEVNDYGNALTDERGELSKIEGEGVTEELWEQMVAHAAALGWKKGDYKKLNLAFDNRLHAQPAQVRERMVARVEEFAFRLITEVFNARDTAPLALEAILKAGSHDLGEKAERIEDPARWDLRQIRERGAQLARRRGVAEPSEPSEPPAPAGQ